MARLSREKIAMYRKFVSGRPSGIDDVLMPAEDILALLDMADHFERRVIDLAHGEHPRQPSACPKCHGDRLTLDSWNTDGLGKDRFVLSCDNCGHAGEGKTERQATEQFYH